MSRLAKVQKTSVDTENTTDLFAVFKDLHFVLSASGLVIKICRPFSFCVHVLVVVKFSQFVTRFLRTDHGHHWLMVSRAGGCVPHLKGKENRVEENRDRMACLGIISAFRLSIHLEALTQLLKSQQRPVNVYLEKRTEIHISNFPTCISNNRLVLIKPRC